MEEKHDAPQAQESQAPSQDLATILAQLPRSGVDDDVTRIMNLYEVGERRYRAAVQASLPTVSSTASTNA